MLPDNLGQVAMEHLPPLDQCRGIQAPSAPHTSILRATLDRQLILFVLSAVVDARNVLFLAEDEGVWVDSLHLGQITLLEVSVTKRING